MGALLNIGGNFPRLRAKLTHMVGHLPIAFQNSVLAGRFQWPIHYREAQGRRP
ncbi:hypothetical protein Krac_0218 [Ktedonobacter racemifer DSM 44963]|uniref:Uncharacterized protein n=1 Tax=Ktedonobacter racemifer DSM 44963 TaxID=485913 RepID=D6U765_KTERA|nr:hypothetical protein Krac_0218 [Ktedonobacter racemifer DSM 44963]